MKELLLIDKFVYQQKLFFSIQELVRLGGRAVIGNNCWNHSISGPFNKRKMKVPTPMPISSRSISEKRQAIKKGMPRLIVAPSEVLLKRLISDFIK